MQTAVARAFVQVLGDDGSVLYREGIRISPAYLMRLHGVIGEIPEGSWGAGGQTIDTERSVSSSATQGPQSSCRSQGDSGQDEGRANCWTTGFLPTLGEPLRMRARVLKLLVDS